jgi:hypothetical protein
MSAQAMVTIRFEADSAQAASDEVNSWTLPAGAQVNCSVSEVIVSGTVDDSGSIESPPSPLEPVE